MGWAGPDQSNNGAFFLYESSLWEKSQMVLIPFNE